MDLTAADTTSFVSSPSLVPGRGNPPEVSPKRSVRAEMVRGGREPKRDGEKGRRLQRVHEKE